MKKTDRKKLLRLICTVIILVVTASCKDKANTETPYRDDAGISPKYNNEYMEQGRSHNEDGTEENAAAQQSSDMETCPFCGGSGNGCGFCGGSGQVSSEAAAMGRHVRGGGSVNDFYPSGGAGNGNGSNSNSSGTRDRICPMCGGDGRCPVCGGRGENSYYGERPRPCPKCYNDGRCPKCMGHGTIPA